MKKEDLLVVEVDTNQGKVLKFDLHKYYQNEVTLPTLLGMSCNVPVLYYFFIGDLRTTSVFLLLGAFFIVLHRFTDVARFARSLKNGSYYSWPCTVESVNDASSVTISVAGIMLDELFSVDEDSISMFSENTHTPALLLTDGRIWRVTAGCSI